MKIFIPSRARAEQKSHTFEQLPASVRERTQMVVPWEDFDAYAARFGVQHVVGCASEGIGPTRQRIIDISDGPVLMLDDDLGFFVRRDDDPTKLTKAKASDISRMVLQVQSCLRKHAHVGIAVREGANRNAEDFLYNTRMLRALGYDAAVLKEENIRFDRLPVMEDFDVALQLLRKGYASVTLNRWVQDQGTSNAPGGCSTYRTKEVQAAGAHGLAKLHPDYVSVVQKETKGAWGGGVRTDVRIAWKKAYTDAR